MDASNHLLPGTRVRFDGGLGLIATQLPDGAYLVEMDESPRGPWAVPAEQLEVCS